MSDAQSKIDSVAGSARLAKRGLHDQLMKPSALTAVAGAHPLLATLPPEKQEAAARRLMSIAYMAASKNSLLMKCSADSIVQSVVEAAQLGLSVDGAQGHAYLVPYWDGKSQTNRAQLQIGYRGYAHLAYGSGEVARLSASTICEGDDFSYEEGTDPFLKHRIPLDRERGKIIGAYALCHLKGAEKPLFRVMPLNEVLEHRDRSQGYQAFVKGKSKTNPWDTDFGAMAAKTAVRMLAKLMPQETMQRVSAVDEQRDFGISSQPFSASGYAVEFDSETGEVTSGSDSVQGS